MYAETVYFAERLPLLSALPRLDGLGALSSDNQSTTASKWYPPSMSDSDSSLPPSDETISQALRNVVISLHKAGNTDELTVKRVRTRAETSLGLPEGYFKGDQRWKQKSHDVILDAVVSGAIT